MRVRLFVQDGESLPKCVGSETTRHSEHSEIVWVNNPPPLRSRRAVLLSEEALVARDEADRWWLVECANAKAGRGTILALQAAKVGEAFTCDFQLGHILASGGRAA